MQELRARLSSTDADVLKQSLDFARHRAALEAERGKTAETRAGIMVTFLGILTVLLVRLAEPINSLPKDAKWTLGVTLVVALLFIAKGFFSAMQVISLSSRYRLEVSTIFDFQKETRLDALKEEIAATMWETGQSVQTNTTKLFHLQRSQRNAFMAILFVMLDGGLWLAAAEISLHLPRLGFVAATAIGLASLVGVDAVAERRGIWRNRRDARP